MTIARHTFDEQKILLEKEKKQMKKGDRYYWFVLFLVCVFVGIIVFAIWHYFF